MSNGDAAQDLLARLQSQFGDMDVNSFLQGQDNSSPSQNNTNKGLQSDNDDDCDDESSLEEPTPEELRAWQEAQFQKGKMRTESKKILDVATGENARKSALQRRRQAKTAQQRTLLREYEKTEEADDWEHLPQMPDFKDERSSFFPNCLESDASGLELAGGVHPLLQKLVQEGDPEVLGTTWTRLYSSSDGDGLSFRNLCTKIYGYNGPTLMLIGGVPSASRSLTPDKGNGSPKRVSLGFFTIDSWSESEEFFGTDEDCFLFALDYDANNVRILRPKARAKSTNLDGSATQASPPSKRSRCHMYCHPSSLLPANRRRVGSLCQTNGSVHGIGVGGTPSQPRLHLTESLEECRALSYDQLFEDGDLLLGKGDESLYYFDVDNIEIWGVGGEEWIADALAAQKKERDIRAANLEQVRKVDKKQFIDDFNNGLIWRSGNSPGLFGHRNLVDERDF